MEKISEQTAQRFKNSLGQQLINCDVDISSDVTLEHDVLHASSDDTYYRSWIIVDDDVNDLSVVRVTRSLASSLTDLACGGTGLAIQHGLEQQPQSGEGRVLNLILTHLLEELSLAYSALAPTTLLLANNKESAEAENHQSYSSAFLSCINFYLTAGDAKGTISILYPTSQFGNDDYFNESLDRTSRLDALKERLLDIRLPVSVSLGQHTCSLGKMLELDVGDIIPLETIHDAEVRAGGKLIGTGEVMTNNANFLVKLSTVLNKLGTAQLCLI